MLPTLSSSAHKEEFVRRETRYKRIVAVCLHCDASHRSAGSRPDTPILQNSASGICLLENTWKTNNTLGQVNVDSIPPERAVRAWPWPLPVCQNCTPIHSTLHQSTGIKDCTGSQISNTAPVHRYQRLHRSTGIKDCTGPQVSKTAPVHRYQRLHRSRGIKDCTSSQVSKTAPVHRYQRLHQSTDIKDCTGPQVSKTTPVTSIKDGTGPQISKTLPVHRYQRLHRSTDIKDCTGS